MFYALKKNNVFNFYNSLLLYLIIKRKVDRKITSGTDITLIKCKTAKELHFNPRESTHTHWGASRDVVAKVLDCDIIVNEFELQSHYYVHFRTNTVEKGMNPLIPFFNYGFNSITSGLLRRWLWH